MINAPTNARLNRSATQPVGASGGLTRTFLERLGGERGARDDEIDAARHDVHAADRERGDADQRTTVPDGSAITAPGASRQGRDGRPA